MAKVVLNKKLERFRKITKPAEQQSDRTKLIEEREKYETSFRKILDQNTQDTSNLEASNKRVVEALENVSKDYVKSNSIKKNKFSKSTKNLIEKRM